MKLVFLALGFITSAAFAETRVSSVIMMDEKNQSVCQAQVGGSQSLLVRACQADETEEVLRLDQVEKNPQVAVIGSVLQGLVSYYMICSTIQFAPDLLAKLDDATDQRTMSEKLKDAIYASEDRATKEKVMSFTGILRNNYWHPLLACRST